MPILVLLIPLRKRAQPSMVPYSLRLSYCFRCKIMTWCNNIFYVRVPCIITKFGLWAPNPSAMMTSSNGNIFRGTVLFCGEFTSHKGQWRGPLMFSLICAWINGWVSNREADDLRRHCVHYDVTVMSVPDATHQNMGKLHMRNHQKMMISTQ